MTMSENALSDSNLSATTVDVAREKHVQIGVITEIHGPVVVIACETLPPLRQALYTKLDQETVLFEVHQHVNEHRLRAITLHHEAGLYRGMPVFDTGAPLHVPVAPECLGRLLNAFGEPLDDGAPLPATQFRNIHSRPAPMHESVGAGGVGSVGVAGVGSVGAAGVGSVGVGSVGSLGVGSGGAGASGNGGASVGVCADALVNPPSRHTNTPTAI